LLREFIFWFGIRFLHNIIGDGATVFVFLDLILYLLIYRGFSLCKKAFYPQLDQANIQYLFFAVLLFFPYVLGMHNTYRQILAATVFLISIGLIGNRKTIKGYLVSLVAVFIHNASGLFLPLLMITTKSKFIQYSSFLMLIPVIIFLLTVSDSNSDFITREGFEIGQTIKYMYLIVFTFLLGALLFLELKIEKRKNKIFVGLFFISYVIYLFTVFSISSEQAQRLSFYIFCMLFPFMGYYCSDRFKPRIITNLIFFHLSLAPLLLIYNTTIDVSL